MGSKRNLPFFLVISPETYQVGIHLRSTLRLPWDDVLPEEPGTARSQQLGLGSSDHRNQRVTDAHGWAAQFELKCCGSSSVEPCFDKSSCGLGVIEAPRVTEAARICLSFTFSSKNSKCFPELVDRQYNSSILKSTKCIWCSMVFAQHLGLSYLHPWSH